jgi:hypothetical protein
MLALTLFALLLIGLYFRFIGNRHTLTDGLYALAILTALVLIGVIAANATAPKMTAAPAMATQQTCKAWAAKQNEDVIYMWGQTESGATSPAIAKHRLVGYCMGLGAPEIVNFGSSVGFDEGYCAKNAAAPICEKIRQ